MSIPSPISTINSSPHRDPIRTILSPIPTTKQTTVRAPLWSGTVGDLQGEMG